MLDSDITSNIVVLSSLGNNTYARALVEFSAEEELKYSIVFDHVNDKCPKNPKVDTSAKAVNDGFTIVTKRKSKPNQKKQVEGKVNVLNIPTQNSFGALTDDEEKGDMTTILNEDSDCEEVDAEMVFDDRNGQTFTTKGIKHSVRIGYPMINVSSWKVQSATRLGNALWLREIEAANVVAFNQAVLAEEMFLKQKAKISWLKDGDSNTAYFHKSVKSRVSRSRIDVISNSDGIIFANDKVPDAFVAHYEAFLGQTGYTNGFDGSNLFSNCLDEQGAAHMVRTVTDHEIKEAMFSMGDEKSPGPDGFSAAFFKEAWHIVGVDVINAIREFYYNCLFRVVTCAFKVDIQKAYDTVDWAFLKSVLMGFGFHERMIAWIMECVSSTSYSICINGNLHGYFQGKRGLRQGDPLSPYLFTLVMEVLTLMFKRKVMDSDCFSFHRYCDKLELINLCFADDLFIFAYGDVQSVVVIKECLDEFKHASGLIPSIPKSTAFFCNVLNHVKLSILNVLPFEEGRLPVKYLGVPLVSSRLKARACRLQLIRSVISSMHVFWASVFVIPNRVLMDIEQCMRNFLWCPSSSSKGKAKVAWELVCLPKDEGGLGIRRLEHFNSALLVSHIWNLLSLKESLWVKWVHAYKLNGRNFWDVPIRGNMSWSWQKILQLRPSIREFIWRKIGLALLYLRKLVMYSRRELGMAMGILHDKYQFLNECTVPLSNNCDTLEWRLYDGTVKRFSVAQVWECIRPRADKVPWSKIDDMVKNDNLIWFAMGIPRQLFNLWLIINHKLKTHDRVSIWDYSNVLGSTCPLCEATPDSHEHLFFICPFANSRFCESYEVKAGHCRVFS
ncbi:reverse transcriptase domain-containing protein [Tanacetum coccineum]